MALQTVVNHLMFTRKRFDVFIEGMTEREQLALCDDMVAKRDTIYKQRRQAMFDTWNTRKRRAWTMRRSGDMFIAELGNIKLRMKYDPKQDVILDRQSTLRIELQPDNDIVRCIPNTEVELLLTTCGEAREIQNKIAPLKQYIETHRKAFGHTWKQHAHSSWRLKWHNASSWSEAQPRLVFTVHVRAVKICNLTITYPCIGPNDTCRLHIRKGSVHDEKTRDFNLTPEQAARVLKKRPTAMAKWVHNDLFAKRH